MNPNKFLTEIVVPNMDLLRSDSQSALFAFNAIAAVDALSARIFYWCCNTHPAEMKQFRDDTNYRQSLSERSQEFKILRDTAKAQKHARLVQGNPTLKHAGQVRDDRLATAMSGGSWSLGISVPTTIYVKLDTGQEYDLITLLEASIDLLKKEMVAFTII